MLRLGPCLPPPPIKISGYAPVRNRASTEISIPQQMILLRLCAEKDDLF